MTIRETGRCATSCNATCTTANVLRERARGREREREHVSDAGPDVAARQLAEFEALSEVPEGLRSPVRTDRPVGELLPELEDRVNQLLG